MMIKQAKIVQMEEINCGRFQHFSPLATCLKVIFVQIGMPKRPLMR